MRIVANSGLITAVFSAVLTSAPHVPFAQPTWIFDEDLFGSLGSFEIPLDATPKTQLIANVEPVEVIDCAKARVIVADYGFKDIKAESCSGDTLDFGATRDGKRFFIKIFATDAEFAEVRRLR